MAVDLNTGKPFNPAEGLPEESFQQLIVNVAMGNGWRVMHISDSRLQRGGRFVGDAMCKGWPDLVLVKGRTILFRELKAKGGRPTAEQLAWLGALTAAGCDCGVWYPADWPLIEETLERGRD